MVSMWAWIAMKVPLARLLSFALRPILLERLLASLPSNFLPLQPYANNALSIPRGSWRRVTLLAWLPSEKPFSSQLLRRFLVVRVWSDILWMIIIRRGEYSSRLSTLDQI